MKTLPLKTLLWLSIFAIAMGFLESSVVIYLRELYYPSGFQFPLEIIPSKIAKVELWREAATIIMLIGAGYMAGKNALTRFAYFLIAFAIWDIFYYVFLYLFIGWPNSLFTWDILFLIPAPWTGPVIAPCLVAMGMIVFGLSILHANKDTIRSVSGIQWILLIGGVIIIISSFLYDYFVEIRLANTTANFLPTQQGLLNELKHYVPKQFNWFIFFSGLLVSSLGTFFFIQKNTMLLKLKPNHHEKK